MRECPNCGVDNSEPVENCRFCRQEMGAPASVDSPLRPSSPEDIGKWRYTIPGVDPTEVEIIWDERGFTAIYMDGVRQFPVHMLEGATWEKLIAKCDCQDPDHGFVSNECEVHNENPYPKP